MLLKLYILLANYHNLNHSTILRKGTKSFIFASANTVAYH